MSKKIPTKLIVGIVGILVLLGGLYFFVFDGDSAGVSSSLQVASTTAVDGSGADTMINTDQILQQLNELRRITISPEFFNSPAFLSLKDFGFTLNPQDIGRENPFAPSTYVPAGDSIVPRSNTAIFESTDDEAEVEADDSGSSATTSTSTESAGN